MSISLNWRIVEATALDSEGVKIDENGDTEDGDNQKEEYRSGGGLLGSYGVEQGGLP